MAEKQNLATRLAVIAGQIGYIKKGGFNEAQKYKFVSESDVVAELKPRLAEAGILVVPSHRLLSVEPFVTTKGSQQFLTTIESTFTFTDGTESIVVQTIGQGTDAGDKGVYKAMTGAKKYALLQGMLLATGDDPEVARDDERPVVPTVKKAEVSDDSLTETQRKRIFALAREAKISTDALGVMRLDLTGKHSSKQMTNDDGKKLIEALQEHIKQIEQVEAITGGERVE